MSRYASPLAEHHDESHLTKFELLLEASLDLEAVPQEYLISAAYDSRLQVGGLAVPHWGIQGSEQYRTVLGYTGQYSTGLSDEDRAYKERPGLEEWLGRGDYLSSRNPQDVRPVLHGCGPVSLS